MNTEQISDFVWDTHEIARTQAKWLVESGECQTEEAAYDRVYSDQDLFQQEWEDLTDALGERLEAINPDGHWYVEVHNFGWRNQHGYKEFTADDGRTFLQEILPNTDCRFRIYFHDKEIHIQNFHHDSPTGNEWYTVLPARHTELDQAA